MEGLFDTLVCSSGVQRCGAAWGPQLLDYTPKTLWPCPPLHATATGGRERERPRGAQRWRVHPCRLTELVAYGMCGPAVQLAFEGLRPCAAQ